MTISRPKSVAVFLEILETMEIRECLPPPPDQDLPVRSETRSLKQNWQCVMGHGLKRVAIIWWVRQVKGTENRSIFRKVLFSVHTDGE